MAQHRAFEQRRGTEPHGGTRAQAMDETRAKRGRRSARTGKVHSHPKRRGPPAAAPEDICFHVDRAGRQHFNFEQQVWLDPLVQMACTRVHSTALTTLAVNLLTLVLRERNYPAAVGTSCRQAVVLARAFSDDCLLSAPGNAWVMPRSAIRAWIHSHRRARGARR
ncbi:MAG: hypothetical protein ACREU2_06640 [Steroidobacteraceae bacterium]